MTYFFRVHETQVVVELLTSGHLKLADSGSEQCEGCGLDIVETGTAHLLKSSLEFRGRPATVAFVTCPCGARYTLHRNL